MGRDWLLLHLCNVKIPVLFEKIISVAFLLGFQESLPEIQKEHRNLLKELKVIQENEHALQKDALSIKLKLEQVDGHIGEHNSKIKYWQKEVRIVMDS